MSRKKFGEEENSIARTLNLPGASRGMANRYYFNVKKYYREFAETEMWAKRGFVSGYSVLRLDDGGEDTDDDV